MSIGSEGRKSSTTVVAFRLESQVSVRKQSNYPYSATFRGLFRISGDI